MRITSHMHSGESRLLNFAGGILAGPNDAPQGQENESRGPEAKEAKVNPKREANKRVDKAEEDVERERDRAGEPGVPGVGGGAPGAEVGLLNANVNIAAAGARADARVGSITIENNPQINVSVTTPRAPVPGAERREVDDMALLQRLNQEYMAALAVANPRNVLKVKMDQLVAINRTLEQAGSAWRVSNGPKLFLLPYQSDTGNAWQTLPRAKQNRVITKVQQYMTEVGRGKDPVATLSHMNEELARSGVQEVHLEKRGTFAIPFVIAGAPPRIGPNPFRSV